MLKYGTDKPDLRNPLIINDITEIFTRDDVKFDIFKKLVKSGSVVRCLTTKNTMISQEVLIILISGQRTELQIGILYHREKSKISASTVGKFFSEDSLIDIMKKCKAETGDSILACGKISEVEKILSASREKIAKELNLIDENEFAFCWITDYPMYELDELTKKVKFSHNFSMPQGDISKIDFENPLNIKAYQYDIVCNGVELSPGAIRNHIPELMYKLFSVVGYKATDVNQKFSGMINALSYGAPPHGGIAPGVDRLVMLLADERNIREITLFPMNQNAQDLMMNAPSNVDDKQLKELGIKIDIKKN